MSRNEVTFTISGDASKAVAALDSILKRLDDVSKHKAFVNLHTATANATGATKQLAQAMGTFHSQMRQLATTAGQYGTKFNSLVQVNNRWNTSVRNVTNNTNKWAAAQNQVTQSAQRTLTVYRAMDRAVGNIVTSMSRGLRQAAASMRASGGQIAGSMASTGIGFRMSGIALGQQLSSLGAGPLMGNVLSGVINFLRRGIGAAGGVATTLSELIVRAITGPAGGLVKLLGTAIGGAVQAAMTFAASFVHAGGTGILKALGGVLAGAGFIFRDLLASGTQIAGEMVVQMGNIFTGLAEIMRGAMQGAVNVAAQVLNGLVSVAQGVAEKIAGALGGVAKAVFGTAGVLGGLAIRDIVQAEEGLTRGTILLDPGVSAERRAGMAAGIYDQRRRYSNLGADQGGLALETFLSTGFQARPEDAMARSRAAMRLASAGGEESVREIARTMAKTEILFGPELEKQAQDFGTNVGDLIADKLQTIRNYGDITIGELANRFGEVLGVGKQVGLTFDEIATTLSQLTLGLGVEQSFTGLQQLFETFTTLTPDAKMLLKRKGIEYKTFSADEEAQLSAMRERIRLAGDDKKAVKELTKEYADLEDQLGSLKNLLVVLEDVQRANLSDFEMSEVFDNIRARRAAAALFVMDPAVKEQTRKGVTEQAVGASMAAFEERTKNVGFKLSRILKEATQPFVTFWEVNKERILSGLDAIIAKLEGLNAFWAKALQDPGAAKFVDNLKEKFGGLFSGLFGGVDLTTTPAGLWEGMNAALDGVWAAGEKVAAVFSTLWALIKDLASASELLKSAWEGIKSAGSSISETFSQLSKGDTSNLIVVWGEIQKVWAEAKETFFSLMQTIVVEASRAFQAVMQMAESSGFMDLFRTFGAVGKASLGVAKTVIEEPAASVGAFGSWLGAGLLLKGGLGGGGVGRGPGGVGGGFGGGVGGTSLGYRAGAALRRVALPVAVGASVYEHLQGPPQDFGEAMGRTGGAALTGFMAGGPLGALIGGGLSILTSIGQEIARRLNERDEPAKVSGPGWDFAPEPGFVRRDARFQQLMGFGGDNSFEAIPYETRPGYARMLDVISNAQREQVGLEPAARDALWAMVAQQLAAINESIKAQSAMEASLLSQSRGQDARFYGRFIQELLKSGRTDRGGQYASSAASILSQIGPGGATSEQVAGLYQIAMGLGGQPRLNPVGPEATYTSPIHRNMAAAEAHFRGYLPPANFGANAPDAFRYAAPKAPKPSWMDLDVGALGRATRPEIPGSPGWNKRVLAAKDPLETLGAGGEFKWYGGKKFWEGPDGSRIGVPQIGGMTVAGMGSMRGSMGRDIREAAGFGVSRVGQGTSGFATFGGAATYNPQSAFIKKMGESYKGKADALKQKAGDLLDKGDTAGAEAAMEAAKKFEEAANTATESAKESGKSLAEIAEQMQASAAEQTEAIQGGVDALESAVQEIRAENKRLKKEMSELRKRLDEKKAL